MQLSDETRQRIRAEEIFRDEVRRQLQPAQSTKSTAAAFFSALNKPLALWFLSSVVLTGIGWSYTSWEEKRAVSVHNRTQITKLDIEVYGRLKRASTRLDSARNPVGLRDAIAMLDKGFGVSPELANLSLEGLLLSLSWLVPKNERDELEKVRDAYHELQQLKSTPDEEAVEVIARVKSDYLNGSFAVRGWRDR